MTTTLTHDAYERTLTERMVNVTGIAGAVIDIWPYVNELVAQNMVPESVFAHKTIEIIYQNENKTFNHILLPTETGRVFMIVIIDLVQKNILGHYRQDLNEVYGVE